MALYDVSTERLIRSGEDGLHRNLVIATFCACMGPFSFGYTLGYSSSAIPDLEKVARLGKYESAWFGSLMPVGAMMGGPLAGLCIEKFGRKRTLLANAVPFILGYLLIARSLGLVPLYLGRLLTGLGSGMSAVCCPVYIAETSPKGLRGFLGTCTQLCVNVGILAVYVCGMYLGWEVLAYAGILVPVLSTTAACCVPETPRWLLLQKRRVQAIGSLQRLRRPRADVEEECCDMEEGLDVRDIAFADFAKPEFSRPLKIAVGLMGFQQLSGINAMLFYAVPIFNAAGFSDRSRWATAIVGAVNVGGTCVASLLMDRIGRRKLLLASGSTMTLSLLVMGLCYIKVDSFEGASYVGYIAVGSLILFVTGFALGWGPIPMLVMSEIFPSRAKGRAGAVSVFVSWLTAFIITKEFVIMQDMAGKGGTFWLFALFCVLGLLFVWKMLPETKGKSLEDIELYFLGRSLLQSPTHF